MVSEQLPSSDSQLVQRREVDFPPSIWSNYFSTSMLDASQSTINDFDKVEEHIQKLKMEVAQMLSDVADPIERLDLINEIQRLGVGYRFEQEIDEALRKIYTKYFKCENGGVVSDDLHTTSLLFRLLRLQGYAISCDVFNKFKNEDGCFKESLISDVRGMLSLYEASHFRVHGEQILEDSLAFTTKHLNKSMEEGQLVGPIAAQVSHALRQCLRKGLTRLEARLYMPIYQKEDSHSEVLLTLAKLDFNLLQKQHQKELSEITGWWKDLDFATNLHFARDRVVECYFWILGVYFEPKYLYARRLVTKIITLTSVMDDIYDVYGTPEELQLFTDAIDRWNVNAMDGLPEYLQVFYKALLDVYKDEIEEKFAEEDKSYVIYYAKEAMKLQAHAYFDESKWLHIKHVPTFEEYMKVAVDSSGYVMLASISFVGMEDYATKHAFEWASKHPKIVMASAAVARLMDDIVSHKFEQDRGHVSSAVQCYAIEHGVTEEEAERALQVKVDDAWKDINESCLSPLPVPMPLLKPILNLACVIDLLYKDKDRYTHPDVELKEFIASLLVNPIN